ncbi:hypothetical protein NKH77_50560 [Streptomyces sp. M19]
MSHARRLAAGVLAPVVYVLVVVPLGVCARVFRDPLRRRPDRGADSYWHWVETGSRG